MLKNKFLTAIDVPFGAATEFWSAIVLPSIVMAVPSSVCSCLVLSSTCAIAAILASASPLNPFVCKANKSSAALIFEVA